MDYTATSAVRESPSVTLAIRIPTDRTEQLKHSIEMKNLFQNTKKELVDRYQKRAYEELASALELIEVEVMSTSVPGSYVYFISNQFYEGVKLPFEVENDYYVSDRFITKKIIRKLSDTHHYYVLTLSEKEARLLEYHKETLIKEVKDTHFPVLNQGYWTSDRLLNSMGSVRSNYQKEFYKLVDSELQYFINKEPHPIVLAGVSENVAVYKQIANQNERIVGELNGNFTSDKGESPLEIGQKSAQLIEAYVESEKQQVIASLDQFNSQGRLESDLVTIYMAAINGRAQKLIVDSEYYHAAHVKDGQVRLTDIDATQEDYVEDIVNEIIYQVMRYGGEVIFSNAKDLKEYAPIVLRTRY